MSKTGGFQMSDREFVRPDVLDALDALHEVDHDAEFREVDITGSGVAIGVALCVTSALVMIGAIAWVLA
jgi:hypothetical protein